MMDKQDLTEETDIDSESEYDPTTNEQQLKDATIQSDEQCLQFETNRPKEDDDMKDEKDTKDAKAAPNKPTECQLVWQIYQQWLTTPDFDELPSIPSEWEELLAHFEQLTENNRRYSEDTRETETKTDTNLLDLVNSIGYGLYQHTLHCKKRDCMIGTLKQPFSC
jgi:hypothetical protein